MTSTEFVLEVITVFVVSYICVLFGEWIAEKIKQRVDRYLSISEKTFSYNHNNDKEKKCQS